MLQALAVKEGALDREDLYVRLCPMLLNRGRELKPHLDKARALFPQNPTLHMYEQVVCSMDGDTSALRYLRGFRSNELVRRAIAEAYHHACPAFSSTLILVLVQNDFGLVQNESRN